MGISQDNCLVLIDHFRKFPELWNPKHEHYFNNLKKEDAWDQIANLMNMAKEDCRKKMESLKGSYRRERAIIKKTNTNGQGTEDVYKSNWFAFDAMAFLSNRTDPPETISSISPETAETTQEIMERTESVETVSKPKSFKSPKFNRPVSKRKNSVRLNEAFEHLKKAAQPNPPQANKRKKSVRLDEAIENLKKAAQPDHLQVNKRKNSVSLDEAIEHLKKAAQPDPPQDECSSFGLYVANKIRRYSEYERSLAQHRISNVLYEIDIAKFGSMSSSFQLVHQPYHANPSTAQSTDSTNSPSPSTSSLNSESAQCDF